MKSVATSFGHRHPPGTHGIVNHGREEKDDGGCRKNRGRKSEGCQLMSKLDFPVKKRIPLSPSSSSPVGETATLSGKRMPLPGLETPVLLKSVSAPVLPSFKPQDQRSPKPDGCLLISPQEFNDMITEVDSDDLLVLDVRPFSDYSRSCLKESVHVCLPSTLLRRKSFNFRKLIDNLPPQEQLILKEQKLKNRNLRIIIYDGVANQRDCSVSLACGGIATKILDSYPEGLPFKSVSILASGFSVFESKYGEHVTSHEDSMVSSDSASTMDLRVQITEDLSQDLMPPHQICIDSPVSSSSPISALSKFKLPHLDNSPSHMFKIAQNEQLMNIESYLSAVNIKEENEEHSMQSFQFPKVSGNDKPTTARDKLRFQVKYEALEETCESNEINAAIPSWFQKLMERSKIDFISQFQKLDFLERKRLNKGFNKHKSSLSASFCPRKLSEVNGLNNVQCRSYSQPACIQSLRRELKNFYSVESDEEDDLVTISSGVELGVKNRYKDIFPYEHTRVVLKKSSTSSLPSNFEADSFNETWKSYINANYLDVPICLTTRELDIKTPARVRYIATQAPLASTVHDFFTCILNNHVPLVITLTDDFENGMEKCYPYWKNGQYDDITATVLEEDSISTRTASDKVAKVHLRRLQLSYDGNKTFEVLQLHIKDWPDLGTLLDPTQIIQAISLKDFVVRQLLEKNVYSAKSVPTILVHCSAGCGRTGTWCTIDSIISNLDAYNVLQGELDDEQCSSSGSNLFDPIVWTINTFRKQRISIVQNINQFLFIYECLLYYFTLKIEEQPRVRDQLPLHDSMNNLLHQIEESKIIRDIIDTKTHEQLPSFA